MDTKKSCGCAPLATNLVFACSGAADVGAVADQAARKLNRDRVAYMCCAAAIAAGDAEITAKARQATRLIAIDGCEKICARRILERAGLTPRVAIQLDQLQMTKGHCPPKPETVSAVVNATLCALSQSAKAVLTGEKT